MSEDSKEKQNKPTAKRLEQLKKDGSFLRAREFYAGITLIAALIALWSSGTLLQNIWMQNFQIIFSNLDLYAKDELSIKTLIPRLLLSNLLSLSPFFIVLICIFLFSVSILGGLHFSSKLVKFKGERLSLNKNLSRIYSVQALIEIGKSLLKVILFFIILYLFFKTRLDEIMGLGIMVKQNVINHSAYLIKNFLIQIMGAILLIALIDALINYMQYQKKAMMSHQEIKDESKETDGNPEVKRKIRQAQQAISMQQMQKEMPNATIVLVNPTHYAVALRYIDKKDTAPVIIAKGVDHMAMQIRQLANRYAVPVYQAPELTRAIYHSGQQGQTIDPELYMAVAIVLSYILQLKEYQLGRGVRPAPLREIEVPEQFKSKK